MKSIVSAKTEIRNHSLCDKGTFAIQDINKGEMIYIRGGELMKKEEAFNYKPGECPDGLWPITEDYWLGARTEEDFVKQKVYVNHSCDANCGLSGEITCVAMRDIKVGEEITQDYGLLDDSDYELECSCGSANCRKVATGQDWQLPDLQEQYYDYYAPYLKKRIIRSQK